jgi:hypothetical protein
VTGSERIPAWLVINRKEKENVEGQIFDILQDLDG